MDLKSLSTVRVSNITTLYHLEKPQLSTFLLVLFHISDIDVSTIQEKPTLSHAIKKKLGMLDKMTAREFELQVKKICSCCLKHIKDLHELHLKRSKGKLVKCGKSE